MKRQKRRIELLSFYDHTGIERHLADMAREGWMIEKITNYFWTYRRIKPQQLSFTVSYFSNTSDFEPAPSEARQTFIDFCTESGWELACTWYQMQIFYHTGQSPTPIHTDPALEVETIHRGCKTKYLRMDKVLCFLSLIGTLLFFSSLISDTLRIVASPTALVGGMCCLVLFLFCSVELAAYYTWYRKAKKAAEYEIFLDTPSTSGFQKRLMIVLGLCAAYWIINMVFAQNPLAAGILFVVVVLFVTITSLVNSVKQVLKQKRVSAGINRMLTTAASFVITFVLSWGILTVGTHILSHVQPEDLFPYEEPPLRISDLLDTEYSNYLTTVSTDRSLFLSRMEFYQREGFDDEASQDIPMLKYERYDVIVPELYGFCESQMKRLMLLSAFWNGKLVEQDAAPWGAKNAYRLIMQDATGKNLYLLCYTDTLVQIEFNWNPTEEQMHIVGERLDGNRV